MSEVDEDSGFTVQVANEPLASMRNKERQGRGWWNHSVSQMG